MKKNGNKTKKLLLSVLFMVVVLGGVYAYSIWQLSTLNAHPRFQDIEGNMISRFQIGSNAVINPVSGNVVNFDLGSRHSFINRRSAERLDSLGWPVRIMPTLVYTTDSDGRFKFYTQKAILDVTLPNPELPDSTFVIHNVELLLTDGDNVYGMDLLKDLVIERLWPEGIISFYKEVPKGYTPVCDIEIHDSPLGNYIGSTGRASVKLAVNDEPERDYFFDTGGKMRNVEIVQPYKKRLLSLTPLDTDSATGSPLQHRCRVNFGNRVRFSEVLYCDTLHTDQYSVNPLLLFDQDFVIDMKGRKLMVHKTRQ